MTELGTQLMNASTEEGLKIIGEIYMPSILIMLIAIFFITLMLGLIFVKKNFGNFVVIFLFPIIAAFIFLAIIFIFPMLPEWTASWFKGALT